MVTLGADVLSGFPRFTLYNSPYIAHREGRAIDLYPGTEMAPSPVAGEVRLTETMGCPNRPYAAENDHLIVIDTGERLARILHVDPTVDPGTAVAVGDPLGRLIRSGYFAPWVDNHIHLGFRQYGTDPVRARGSLRLEVEAPLAGVDWDGRGTVAETGETYAILDTPSHPAPGERYVGITDDSGQFLLDGGLPHYPNGGIVPVPTTSTQASAPTTSTEGSVGPWAPEASSRTTSTEAPSPTSSPTGSESRSSNPDADAEAVELLGLPIGPPDGRELPWEDVQVFANGTKITGLSFFVGRDAIYVKLITPETTFDAGEVIEVDLSRTGSLRG